MNGKIVSQTRVVCLCKCSVITMGIKNLSKLLHDQAPAATSECTLKNLFGRKIAIDASTFLYSFLVAIRPDSMQHLTDEHGEITSHLQGMFTRTVRFLEFGIRPVYVFDGKPPTLKGGELAKRSMRKKEAEKGLEDAMEMGNVETAEKLVKRTVKVTKTQTEECKKLLRLMGVPVVEAPCEAEATCAELCKKGLVYATGTEDMDALTLGTPILYRRLTFSEQRKMPVLEVHLDKTLEGLELTMPQFVDLCILCGCDYSETIRGIGPKNAYKLIKQHSTLENVIESLDKKKYVVPEDFKDLDALREMFVNPDVIDTATVDVNQKDPDEEGIVDFLVREKNFNEQRVRSAIAKIRAARGTAVQGRLDGFFTRSAPLPKKETKGGRKSKNSEASSSSSSSSSCASSSSSSVSTASSSTPSSSTSSKVAVKKEEDIKKGVDEETLLQEEERLAEIKRQEEEEAKKPKINPFEMMMKKRPAPVSPAKPSPSPKKAKMEPKKQENV